MSSSGRMADLLMLSILTSVVAGCGSAVDEATPSSPPVGAHTGVKAVTSDAPCDDVPRLLAAECAGCHAASSPVGGLDFAASDLGRRLARATSGSGERIVDPRDPERSVLLRRLRGDGPIMPPLEPPLAAEEIACVRSWIAELPDLPPAPAASAPPATPPGTDTVRVAAGLTSPVRDRAGGTWNVDAGFVGGATDTVPPSAPIAGTSTPELYRAERYGTGPHGEVAPFSYSFAIAKGRYTVTLKFAENTYGSVGQRRFAVAIGGKTLLADFDLFAAGGRAAAIDRSFDVDVDVGVPLVIQFLPGKAGRPKVNAIAIVPRIGP